MPRGSVESRRGQLALAGIRRQRVKAPAKKKRAFLVGTNTHRQPRSLPIRWVFPVANGNCDHSISTRFSFCSVCLSISNSHSPHPSFGTTLERRGGGSIFKIGLCPNSQIGRRSFPVVVIIMVSCWFKIIFSRSLTDCEVIINADALTCWSASSYQLSSACPMGRAARTLMMFNVTPWVVPCRLSPLCDIVTGLVGGCHYACAQAQRTIVLPPVHMGLSTPLPRQYKKRGFDRFPPSLSSSANHNHNHKSTSS